MKSVRIIPSQLEGNIKIPASKSLCHRAVICSALAHGESNIDNVILSEDINATCSGVKALGAEVKMVKEASTNNLKLKVKGGVLKVINESIDCTESGSTLRFLIPMALVSENKVIFKGRGKLVTRPLKPYYEIFEAQNINYSLQNGGLPLTINGALKSGLFKLPGNISSQFISGLLFALPLIDGDSKIVITTGLESKGYVDLTLDMLRKFGIAVENNDYKEFFIKGSQKYTNRNYKVEGDFSQAAFWMVAGLLGSKIRCFDLDLNSLQGDKEVLQIMRNMGGEITITEEYVEATQSTTHETIMDASACPDLVPIVAVLGALSTGTTKIINASRLRIKECDRLKAISTELNKLGADIQELEDSLIIKGKERLRGGTVDSWNDHRIAMALAVASIKCIEPVIITNSEVVKKSYPSFWEDFRKLGGNIHEWNMG